MSWKWESYIQQRKEAEMSSDIMIPFFFYGSLRKGKMNHGFLSRHFGQCEYQGTFTTVDENFHMIGLSNLNWPFLTRETPPEELRDTIGAPSRINGELYLINGNQLEGLRALQELEDGYVVRSVSIVPTDCEGEERAAFVYLLEGDLTEYWSQIGTKYIPVPTGNWMEIGN